MKNRNGVFVKYTSFLIALLMHMGLFSQQIADTLKGSQNRLDQNIAGLLAYNIVDTTTSVDQDSINDLFARLQALSRVSKDANTIIKRLVFTTESEAQQFNLYLLDRLCQLPTANLPRANSGIQYRDGFCQIPGVAPLPSFEFSDYMKNIISDDVLSGDSKRAMIAARIGNPYALTVLGLKIKNAGDIKRAFSIPKEIKGFHCIKGDADEEDSFQKRRKIGSNQSHKKVTLYYTEEYEPLDETIAKFPRSTQRFCNDILLV